MDHCRQASCLLFLATFVLQASPLNTAPHGFRGKSLTSQSATRILRQRGLLQPVTEQDDTTIRTSWHLRLRGGSGLPAGQGKTEESCGVPKEWWEGGVVSWGLNLQGRLGNGGERDRFRPAMSEVGDGVLQVSAGDFHSLALLRGGKVVGWGCNGHGQLGDESNQDRLSPVQVAGLSEGFVKVAAGGLHSLALRCDGSVVAWGDNSTGQLGQPGVQVFEEEDYVRDMGYPLRVCAPVVVKLLATGVVDIAAGYLHSLALMQDGRLLGWGENSQGQLGNGKNFTFDDDFQDGLLDGKNKYKCEMMPNRARLPPGIQGRISQIECGGHHSVALLDDGGVLTWGNNHFGQLATGEWTYGEELDDGRYCESWADRLEPSVSPLLLNVTNIAAGFYHNLAILSNGSVLSWGSNQAGQLGLSDHAPGIRVHNYSSVCFAPEPVVVSGLPRSAVAIAAGFATSIAVLDDGSVWAWGANYDGQLGRGSRIDDSVLWSRGKIRGDCVPKQVMGLGQGCGGIEVSAGSSHMLAVIHAEAIASFPREIPFIDEERDWALRRQEKKQVTPLQVGGPEASFDSVRPRVDKDGELMFDDDPELLPSFEVVVTNDTQVPRAPHFRLKWRNVTEAEAREAEMAWPQQYRDGYGTTDPPPEMTQKLLEDARKAAERIGIANIYEGSQGLQEYDAALEELMVDFSQKYHLRAAGHALEDVELHLAANNFEGAKQSARKARVSFIKAGRPRFEETEALLCRIRDGEEVWRLEEEKREIEETEWRDPMYMKYNYDTMSWDEPNFRNLPIEAEQVPDTEYGYMRLEVPLKYRVKDLRVRLKLLLKDKETPLLWLHGQELLDSNETCLHEFCAAPDRTIDIQSHGWKEFYERGECQGDMRFETVDPAFGGDGGQNLVSVKGYNFPEGKHWSIQFGEEGDVNCDGERTNVTCPAAWISPRTIACWAPEHEEASVVVRVFCDRNLVWECKEAYSFVEPVNNPMVALKVKLHHVSVPLNISLAKIRDLHFKTALQAREYVRKFGWFNTTEESYAAVETLHESFHQLLHLDPCRKESLHNYGTFLKDFKRDSAAAKTVFELAGMEMPLTIRANFTEDERREIAETQDWLDSLPEFIRPFAALAPEKIRWSDEDIAENIPKGRYGLIGHICSDPQCKIPKTADPAKELEMDNRLLRSAKPQLCGDQAIF